MARLTNEVVLRRGWDFNNVGINRREGLHFQFITSTPDTKTRVHEFVVHTFDLRNVSPPQYVKRLSRVNAHKLLPQPLYARAKPQTCRTATAAAIRRFS